MRIVRVDLSLCIINIINVHKIRVIIKITDPKRKSYMHNKRQPKFYII